MPDEATEVTRAVNRDVRTALADDDGDQGVLTSRGLIEAVPDLVVRDGNGHIVWNMGRYAFLTDEAPPTVNPRLWRHAILNTRSGLFKVTDGIYQVRGYDISNITFVETRTGVIVVDPLLSVEVARVALALYAKHRGQRPVVAVIYTHTHPDHFGGVKGVVAPADVHAGRVRILAPAGFMRAVSESLAGGNATARRATYMFGNTLETGPAGQIDVGLGKALSRGTISLIPPTEEVTRTGQELSIDGVPVVFQLAPDSEAPAEMHFHFPEQQALCLAENANASLHNLYTLRGSPVRDAKAWSRYLNEAWRLFGARTDVMFTSHFWPRWGRQHIAQFLTKHADVYKYIHDQTMRLANHGYTMLEIAERLRLPESLSREWYNGGYYGTVNHNAKAVYQRYLGFFDGNPASLHALPPEEAAKKYVEFMGGAAAVIAKAERAYAAGEYRWVAQVMSHVIFDDPTNAAGRELAARALEQLGYQAEASTWRNVYLTGAMELRSGVPGGPPIRGVSPDVVRAIPLDMYFEDYLAVRLNGPRAAGKTMTLSWHFTDIDRRCTVVLRNSVLNYREGDDPGEADATLALTRESLSVLTLGRATIEDLMRSGDVRVSGDAHAVVELFGLFDKFDFWFNIVTP